MTWHDEALAYVLKARGLLEALRQSVSARVEQVPLEIDVQMALADREISLLTKVVVEMSPHHGPHTVCYRCVRIVDGSAVCPRCETARYLARCLGPAHRPPHYIGCPPCTHMEREELESEE